MPFFDGLHRLQLAFVLIYIYCCCRWVCHLVGCIGSNQPLYVLDYIGTNFVCISKIPTTLWFCRLKDCIGSNRPYMIMGTMLLISLIDGLHRFHLTCDIGSGHNNFDGLHWLQLTFVPFLNIIIIQLI